MTPEQREEYQFYAYHKSNKKTYPVVSLGVYGFMRKHTLLDIHSDEVIDGEAPYLEVKAHEVNIIQAREDIKGNDDFLKQLGQTVLEIDWVKLGKRLEDEKNYDGGGWEHLAKYWRDNKAFSVYSHFYHRFNKHYHWLDFLDGKGISMNDQQSISILEYLEELSEEEEKE